MGASLCINWYCHTSARVDIAKLCASVRQLCASKKTSGLAPLLHALSQITSGVAWKTVEMVNRSPNLVLVDELD
jgi:hypothetical protein